ncbi:hypothetical protein CPB83DRAFT_839691 [Crepidotus variabilis]|uniref:Uncharacterized protein n=1 Tax=Crepidotus variabilis TaxID=179855 RepID=A0A9P6E6D5_9AGAR|nr:hypothetical protein CPB83DRAFT_839691 [Crepidotus variabilis]
MPSMPNELIAEISSYANVETAFAWLFVNKAKYLWTHQNHIGPLLNLLPKMLWRINTIPPYLPLSQQWRDQFETPLLRVACIKAAQNNHDVKDYMPAKYNNNVYGKLLDICQIEVCKRIEIPEGVRSLRRLGSAPGSLRELHVTHPSPQLELWKQCAYWPNLTTLHLTERMPRLDYLYANILHIHSIETFKLH